MSSCLGIEGLSSLLICLRPSVIGSQGTSLYQVTVGRPSLTTSRGMSLGCCVVGRPLYLVRLLCIVLFFVCLLAWTIHPNLCVCVCVYVIYLFYFLSQRSSRVGKQVCWACSCSHQVCKHDQRFCWFGGSQDPSPTLLRTRTFPICPSCYQLRRKK